MNSPIGWPGGKLRLRKTIIQRFPEHSIYVEVFAGAASVLFGKDRAVSVTEVLNDLDGELTNFWRCVREKPLELIERLRFTMLSKDDWRRNKALVREGSIIGEVERAAAFFMVLRLSFGCKRQTFSYRLNWWCQGFKSNLVEPTISAAHERLQHVLVFNEDFEALIDRCDRAETFFYCDPPHYGTKGMYAHEFTVEDHERLVAALKRVKGKFLLSYGDCKEIRQLYSWARIEEVETRHSIGRSASSRSKAFKELLIQNY